MISFYQFLSFLIRMMPKPRFLSLIKPLKNHLFAYNGILLKMKMVKKYLRPENG